MTLTTSAPPARVASRLRPVHALAGGGALLLVCVVWGHVLDAQGVNLHLGVIPFYGGWHVRLRFGVVLPVALAAACVTAGPALAVSLRWRPLLVASWATATAWATALAVSTGAGGVTEPLRSRFDYWAVVPEVRRLGLTEFVRTFVARLGSYPVHVEGHPPGLPVLYAVADRLGLRGPGWAAAIVIVIGSSTVVAVAIAVRALAGEGAARAALPFVALAPFALFIATTGDAVFMALTAWAIALAALACTRPRPASDRWAAAGGATAGLAAFFTYGVVPLLALMFGVVAVRTRRPRAVVIAGVAAASVAAVWSLFGFGWLDGFGATRHFYRLRAGDDRPYLYFLVANIAVLAVMLGPAVLAALTMVRDRAVVLLVGAALAAVALADLSGLSKAEVERIWLPFMPWITVAVIDLVRRRPVHARSWLAAQASLAIVLQVCIGWPW